MHDAKAAPGGSRSSSVWCWLPAALALLSIASPCALGAGTAADSVEDKGAGLEEIVVTATRRSENLQSVPIAVSVVTADAINNAGFKSLEDLKNLSASLNYEPFSSNGGGFRMRGVGTANFDYSVEQGVSVVVDDVVLLMHRAFGLIGLNDVEQVELLKGPQGMLFGKNADSGVVSATTKNPVLGEFGATASASYGLRADRNLHARVNLPVSDTVAISLSAFLQGENGAGKYVSPTVQQTAGDTEESGVRAKLLYQPSGDLDIVLTGDYATHKDNTPYVQGFTTNPALYTTLSSYGAQPSIHNTNSADGILSDFHREEYGEILKLNYRMSDFILTSVSAYRQGDFGGNAPVDMTPSLFFPINVPTMSQHQFTQEVRLASPRGRFLEYVAGLYYAQVHENSTQQKAGQLGDTTLAPNTYYSLTNGADVFGNNGSSYAGFGQGTAHFTDKAELTAGVRYTHDHNEASLSQIPVSGYTAINIGATPSQPSGSATGNNVSYRVSPAYQLTPDVKVYGTYSTGYKAPGVAYVSALRHAYKAEIARLWELGLKSEFFDHKVRLNLALFDQKYTDFQATQLKQIGQTYTVTVDNAGALRTRGGDVDLDYRITSKLSLSASVNYSDAVYLDYQDGPTLNHAGERLTNAPRWATALGMDYSQAVSNNLLATAHVDYSWKSYVYGVVGDSNSIIPAYGQLGMRFGVGPEDGKWKVGLYGRNILDATYPSGNASFNGIIQTFAPDAKRTVGVFFEFKL
jgi:iron complex outermembrane receptor protein